MRFLEPVQAPIGDILQLAPRLSTLSRKTLGLYSNEKLNATRLLEMIAKELGSRFSFDIVRGTYDPTRMMGPDAFRELDRCDAVILANGD